MARSLNAQRAMTAREAALRSLMLGGDAPATLDRVLERAGLDGRDRAFATELAHGTLKRRRTLAWAVQTCLNKPLDKVDPLLLWVLLLGAYQVLYLERVPAHSAVDESVALASRLGHAGLAATANAVLRRLSRERPQPPVPTPAGGAAALGLYASLPDWIAQSFIDRFGFEEAVRIATGLNAPPRRALRVDLSKWTRAQAKDALEKAGFETSEGSLGIPETIIVANAARGDRKFLERCVSEGKLAVQSEESQYAVQLLAPRPGEVILDVCAGRGVKTGGIAARMGGRGQIIAVDDDAVKLRALEKSAAQFATPVAVIRANARSAYAIGAADGVDAVIVDAPCSGLGIIGRRADARWRKQPNDPARFASVQRDVLARAASHVRPGGRLLYVTCSTSPVEDEDVVAGFLRSNAQWHARRLDPSAVGSAVTSAGDGLLSEPGIDGADGFFYAMLEREL